MTNENIINICILTYFKTGYSLETYNFTTIDSELEKAAQMAAYARG